MSIVAVIGMGAGDEGKGKTTSYLCTKVKNPIVVRFSGGPQAGHTVAIGLKKHVFAHFGSGTLQGVPTFWSRFCPVNPVNLLNEREVLRTKDITPKLFIDPKCPITTPLDTRANRQLDLKNGTCGLGVGTTINREENRRSLLVEDILNPTVFKIKLALIRDYYGDRDTDLTAFEQDCQEMMNYVDLCTSDHILSYSNIIFEGSQGLLLDQNHGFFPHVTRSNTGEKNIIEILKEANMVRSTGHYVPIIDTYYVTRAYQTRHGNGPMTNEALTHNIKENPHETNTENPYQGVFRRSLLDLNLLQYGIHRQQPDHRGIKNLVVTCLDLVHEEYRLTESGRIIVANNEKQFINHIRLGLQAKNVFVSRSPYTSTYDFDMEKWTS